MMALRRVLVEKRLLIMAVGSVVVLDVALYLVGVYPWTARVTAARERAETAAHTLSLGETTLATVQATRAAKIEADGELDTFYTELLPQGLAGARAITYPTLAALARETGLVLERRSSVADDPQDGPLGRLRTTMFLAGEFQSMRRFIHALESGASFIVIEEILLSQREDMGEPLGLTLGVATYYRHEEQA